MVALYKNSKRIKLAEILQRVQEKRNIPEMIVPWEQ
jgi:hypothetical protein